MGYPTFNVGEVLTANDMNAVGLWKVTAQTITNVSSTNYLRVQNAFSSNYDNYRLIINGTGSAPASLVIRFGNAGTSAQTNYQYSLPYWYPNAGGDGIVRATGVNTFMVVGFFSSVRTSVTIDICRPFAAETTQVIGGGVGQANVSFGNALYSTFGYHDTATSYSELFVGTNSAATFSGTLKLYGYRD